MVEPSGDHHLDHQADEDDEGVVANQSRVASRFLIRIVRWAEGSG